MALQKQDEIKPAQSKPSDVFPQGKKASKKFWENASLDQRASAFDFSLETSNKSKEPIKNDVTVEDLEGLSKTQQKKMLKQYPHLKKQLHQPNYKPKIKPTSLAFLLSKAEYTNDSYKMPSAKTTITPIAKPTTASDKKPSAKKRGKGKANQHKKPSNPVSNKN